MYLILMNIMFFAVALAILTLFLHAVAFDKNWNKIMSISENVLILLVIIAVICLFGSWFVIVFGW